jgi:hypothetical protein
MMEAWFGAIVSFVFMLGLYLGHAMSKTKSRGSK